MTIESWIAEFYTEDAETFVDKSDTECLEHSIKKWTGVLPENLEKHGLKYNDYILNKKVLTEPWDNPHVLFDDTTCALCQKYERCHGSSYQEPCVIVVVTGKSCQETYDECEKDPTKMLELLNYVKDVNSVTYP